MALDPKYRLQANRQSLERDYRTNPDDESLVFRLVSVLERLEDHDALVELIESAAQRMPGVLDLQMTRARILSSLGDFEAARSAYNAILEREPGHVDAACALVQAVNILGHQARAFATFNPFSDSSSTVALLRLAPLSCRRLESRTPAAACSDAQNPRVAPGIQLC